MIVIHNLSVEQAQPPSIGLTRRQIGSGANTDVATSTADKLLYRATALHRQGVKLMRGHTPGEQHHVKRSQTTILDLNRMDRMRLDANKSVHQIGHKGHRPPTAGSIVNAHD